MKQFMNTLSTSGWQAKTGRIDTERFIKGIIHTRLHPFKNHDTEPSNMRAD